MYRHQSNLRGSVIVAVHAHIHVVVLLAKYVCVRYIQRFKVESHSASSYVDGQPYNLGKSTSPEGSIPVRGRTGSLLMVGK